MQRLGGIGLRPLPPSLKSCGAQRAYRRGFHLNLAIIYGAQVIPNVDNTQSFGLWRGPVLRVTHSGDNFSIERE